MAASGRMQYDYKQTNRLSAYPSAPHPLVVESFQMPIPPANHQLLVGSSLRTRTHTYW